MNQPRSESRSPSDLRDYLSKPHPLEELSGVLVLELTDLGRKQREVFLEAAKDRSALKASESKEKTSGLMIITLSLDVLDVRAEEDGVLLVNSKPDPSYEPTNYVKEIHIKKGALFSERIALFPPLRPLIIQIRLDSSDGKRYEYQEITLQAERPSDDEIVNVFEYPQTRLVDND